MKGLKVGKLIFIFLISNMHVFGQKIQFGLVGGLDITNIRITKNNEIQKESFYSPSVNFNANAHFGYKSDGFWGLSLEPGYIQKGSMVNYGIVDLGKLKIQLSYLQLPVWVDFYLMEKLYFSVGPEFSYLINSKIKSQKKSNSLSKLYAKNLELSGNIGINYNIYKQLGIGLKYNHGFTPISSLNLVDENGNKIQEINEINQYFQFYCRFFM